MRAMSPIVAAVLAAGTLAAAPAQAAGSSIKLGNTAPYSGPVSAYHVIPDTEAAYFKMVNEKGGVGGRTIEFLSLDDGYAPPKTVEQTRRLVEQDDVLAMFGSVGTAPNIAVQKYLNAKQVPQLMVSTGASRFNDPRHFPWTTGLSPTYETEGRVYAQYILKVKPDAKIAVITPNEDAGRDYLKGFKDGLGAHANQIVSEATYLSADPTIDSQIITFQQSGANVFFAEATPKFAAQALKKAADLGWKPLIILPTVSNSVSAVLAPAGKANAVGVVSGSYLKDPSDPRWKDDAGMREWLAWMETYRPGADIGDILNVQGFTAAQLMTQFIERCGSDVSRQCLIKQAQSLHDEALPMLLPGIRMNTSADNVVPIQQLQMMRFDGTSWQLIGDVLNADGSGH